MRKLIIKISVMICLVISGVLAPKVNASSSTGHSEFESIDFPEGSRGRLLVNTTDAEKKKALDNVPWKFFGWSVKNICTRQTVFYVGKTIFSRANRTSTPIEFDYYMKIGRTISNSVSISGGLTTKVSGKIKAVSLGIDFKADAKWEKIIKQTEEEKTSFTVKILPNTKISLFIKGVAEVTNGGSKYYAFGVPIKKGNFEFIEVVTEYYELYEEKC